MRKGRGEAGETVTGGRAATVRHVFGERVLSICMPNGKDHPKGWRWVALSDVAQMESGHTPSRNHPEYWGGDIPWISVKDARLAHGKRLSETEEYTNSLGIANSSARLLPEGTVCLSRGGTVGYVVILDKPMATSQGFANWICGPQLVPQFLQYLLLAEAESLEKFSIGTTIKTIYYPDLKAFHVCLPPLAEQKRIVALLDEAFAGIDEAKAKAEANLENAGSLFNNLRECLMKEPEADVPSHGFDEICKINSVLVDPREEENANKLHVGGANIESKTGRLLDLQTARQEGLKSGKFPFEKGMVLYSKIRPNLMKVARPNFGGLCSADMYPLDPNKALICGDYLYHLLLTERFTRFALLGSERAGMPKVNRDYLSKFATKLPTVHEQKTLAMKLDSMEQALGELRELLTVKISSLTELKSSLLAKAYAGELTA